MAAHTSGHGAMFFMGGLGLAMALIAKGVKASLETKFQIGAVTPVAVDAGVHAAPIGKIVVTGQTVHGDVLGVREIERLASLTGQQGLAQCGAGCAANEPAQTHRKYGGNAKYQAGMAPEYQLPKRRSAGRGPRRRRSTRP